MGRHNDMADVARVVVMKGWGNVLGWVGLDGWVMCTLGLGLIVRIGAKLGLGWWVIGEVDRGKCGRLHNDG